MKKRNQCLFIILALVLGLIYPIPETTIADAASEPFITTDSVILESKGETRTIYVKNVKKKKIKRLKVKSFNKSVATAKALSKTSLIVTAACDDGYTRVSVRLDLKKKIRGQKKYSFLKDVDVVEANPGSTSTPVVTIEPSPTPTATVSPTPTSTVKPSSTPTVKPSSTPTAVPTSTPTAAVTPSSTPVVTATPIATATPTVKPTTSPSASATMTPEEVTVYNNMMAMKSEYLEGKPWTDNNKYKWVVVTEPNHTYNYNFGGCAAFAAIISDAGFGKDAPVKQVDNPASSTVRIGDILRINGDSHSVIVLEIKDDGFVVAEGNYNSSIHWGRKIQKTEPIVYLFTRW